MAAGGEVPRDERANLPPVVLVVVFALLGIVTIRALTQDVAAKSFLAIDTRRSRVEPIRPGAGLAVWIDPRWERRLSNSLAELADVSVEDTDGIEAVVREIAAYPFVAEVGEPRVVWPDGVTVPVRFERPVACIAVDGEFLTTTSAARVLPGPWQFPPELSGMPLPILARDSFARSDVRPGVDLEDRDLLDALAVVDSMEAWLSFEDRADLGPIVIDAMRAEETSLEEFGIVIDLEYERRIVFGRSPLAGEPGELPAANKWASVARGIDALRGGLDWSLLDVRWDEPNYVTHDGEEGTL